MDRRENVNMNGKKPSSRSFIQSILVICAGENEEHECFSIDKNGNMSFRKKQGTEKPNSKQNAHTLFGLCT